MSYIKDRIVHDRWADVYRHWDLSWRNIEWFRPDLPTPQMSVWSTVDQVRSEMEGWMF